MSSLDDLVVALLNKTDSGSRRSARTAEVVSVGATTAVVKLSGVTLDPIPFDLNLNLGVGSFARVEIEDNVARIIAKQA